MAMLSWPRIGCFRRGVMSDKMVYLYIWVEEKHSMWVYMRVCTQLCVHVYVCDCCHKTLTSLSGKAAWQDECNWLSQLYLCMLMREAGLQRILQRQIKNATEHKQVNRRCVNSGSQIFTLCCGFTNMPHFKKWSVAHKMQQSWMCLYLQGL